jgi:probable rRNA maturation factor
VTFSAAGQEPLVLTYSLVTEAQPPPGVESDDLEALTAFILAAENASGPWSITVALVDDDRLRALHRDFMGIDEPTDIMTFPSDDPDEARGGELVISVDHALAHAATWEHSPADEVWFLAAHGLLHLLGWRDESDEQRARMLRRQEELIDRWRTRERSGGV